MDLQRILDNTTEDENGCWIWNRSRNSAGYGHFSEDGKAWLAHRYAYVCVNGYIDDGLVVRHKCHNTACCHPDHLQAGTNRDNYHDSLERHREACKKQRKTWIIAGVKYDTAREASAATGIHQGTICKYTYDGVFDIAAYRNGCRVNNVCPRI